MLDHGGRLRKAARHYNIPLKTWLDLSTGINPNGWPVPQIPPEHWARLPEDDDGLISAAQDYYGTRHLLPVAGSQAAIQALPTLFDAPAPIGVIEPGYEEHKHAWQQKDFRLIPLPSREIDASVSALFVLVVIHPNNPTGKRFNKGQLLSWHHNLVSRGGTLIVDEAFMDSTPEHSLLSHAGQEGLVVLRSMGKFFGLAGARVGFVAGAPQVLERLREKLGPWTLNGPARYVARQALQDKDWQADTRQRLQNDGVRLKTLLATYGLPPTGSCDLFSWIKISDAKNLHEALAKKAILTRLFDQPLSLRFGLPGSEPEWQRLAQALKNLQQSK